MADTAVAITAGSGTNIDTRTESTNSNHRQVIVIGDPATNAGVAPVDVTNGLSITQATKIAGEDLTNDVLKSENRFSYATISTATTTTIKSGSGFLHRIVVTGGTTGTIVAYDNTAASGTQIANYDTTNARGSDEYNVSFSTGLTIITSAATKITVSYR